MLPKEWYPVYYKDLIRVGNQGDGGYIIPKEILEKTDILIGLGVNDDWNFEKEFRRYNNCKIYCYDHTVTGRFWIKRLVRDILYFSIGKFKKVNEIKDMFKYFEYRKFFNGKDVVHYKKMIGYQNMGGISLTQIMDNIDQEKVFFKIDIEGWEYRILNDLTNVRDNVLGFVIEFHDVDLHKELISKFISTLSSYKIVHIHANNSGGLDQDGDPITIEVTFLNNKFIDLKQQSSEMKVYPINGLDFPNAPDRADIFLDFSH